MKVLLALASPLSEVEDEFEGNMECMPAELETLCNYFEDTSIGRRQRLGRAAASFAVVLWNLNEPQQEMEQGQTTHSL